MRIARGLKRPFIFWLAVACLFGLVACDKKKPDQGKPLAQVNKYVISEQEFKDMVAESAKYSAFSSLSYENRKTLLLAQVERELLLQKAVEMDLHKKGEFRRAIKKYWEQTLIASLFKEMSDKVGREIIVTDEELAEKYRLLKKARPNLAPLEKIKEKLVARIRAEKKTATMDAWVKGLVKKADCKIYEDNLRAMR